MPVSKQLAIRFAKQGCANRPFYHLVVMLKHKGRDKPPVEQLGSYDPMPNTQGQQMVAINFDRLKYWMAKGAEPTNPVLKLLGLSGFLPIHPMTYIDAKRNRKAEAAKQQEVEQSQESQLQEGS